MKLFAIIFSAILAAAAVIWGVASIRQEHARKAASNLVSINNLARAAKAQDERVSQYTNGVIDPKIDGDSVQSVNRFVEAAGKPLPEGAGLSSIRFNYIYSYVDAIKHARASGDEASMQWAKDTEAALRKAFPDESLLKDLDGGSAN